MGIGFNWKIKIIFVKDFKHDLSGKYVLIYDEFYYFGKDTKNIPKKFFRDN